MQFSPPHSQLSVVVERHILHLEEVGFWTKTELSSNPSSLTLHSLIILEKGVASWSIRMVWVARDTIPSQPGFSKKGNCSLPKLNILLILILEIYVSLCRSSFPLCWLYSQTHSVCLRGRIPNSSKFVFSSLTTPRRWGGRVRIAFPCVPEKCPEANANWL